MAPTVSSSLQRQPGPKAKLLDLEHLHHAGEVGPEPSHLGARIDVLDQGPKGNAALLEVVGDFDQLAEAAGEAGEGMDHQHIAWANEVQGLGQLNPVGFAIQRVATRCSYRCLVRRFAGPC